MYSFFKQLILPPMGPLLVIVVGWLLRRWFRTAGSVLLWCGVVILYCLSTPYFSARLLTSLEVGIEPLDESDLPTEAGAIVVLAAGFENNAPQYGGATVDAIALERLRYGARIHHASGLPVLVSGGQPDENFETLAHYMREVLIGDFSVARVWAEDASSNTQENAKASAVILRQHGIERIFLVSNAFHLKRAAGAFSDAGIKVVLAPASYTEPVPLELGHLLPSPKGLQMGYWAVHEYLGIAWYGVRNWI